MQMSNLEQEMSNSVNRAVNFFGKVLDENELPVQGATVQFGCVVFPQSQILTNVLTDAQGTFALGGLTGAILTVQINKQGYKEAPQTNHNSFNYYSPLPSGGFKPDSNNPVIFRVRKKAE